MDAHPGAVHAGLDEQHGASDLHPRVHATEVHRRRGGAEGHPRLRGAGPTASLLGEIEAHGGARPRPGWPGRTTLGTGRLRADACCAGEATPGIDPTSAARPPGRWPSASPPCRRSHG
ncbi:MAG: hypothetical protein MZW92_19910 [Comamonadaceae bacterium]|nr:hypothetical protein [Comamonadaceae bacterium]